MSAFKSGVAMFTMYPSSINTGTVSLGTHFLYWYYNSATIYTCQNSMPDYAVIKNNGGLLSGTIDAMNGVYFDGSKSCPTNSKIHADFANVRQK